MASKGDFQNGGHKTPFLEHVSLNYQNNASGRTFYELKRSHGQKRISTGFVHMSVLSFSSCFSVYIKLRRNE